MSTLVGPISKYFTWREALASEVAARRGLDNTPDNVAQVKIVDSARRMDVIREFLGHVIRVSSWFRALKVNAAVGSSRDSDHPKGEAVDWECPGFGTNDEVFEALRPRMQEFGIDQLIREYPVEGDPESGWIHTSFGDNPKHEAFIIDAKGKRAA